MLCLSVPGQTSNYFNYISILQKCTSLLCVEFELRFEPKDIARVSRLFCNVDGDGESYRPVNWSRNLLTKLLRPVCSCYALHESELLLGTIGVTRKKFNNIDKT